ncbi:MAG TPA: hypothetical protein VJV03_15100 [Pyrinomonadaceae bacterium]|nr:hypothetical protein [Pyrinomonadaceae bacterium]
MKSQKTTRFVLLICLLLALIPSSGVTADGPAFHVGQYTNKPIPEIRVSSKHTRGVYDTLENPNSLRFNLGIRGQCPEDRYHLQSAKIIVGSYEENVPVNREHKSIGANSGQTLTELSIFVPYIHPDLTGYYNLQNPYYHPSTNSPVEVCNAEVERRVKGGQSKEALLSSGFNLDPSVLGKSYRASFVVWCKSSRIIGYDPDRSYAAGADLRVTIRCLPTDYSEPERAKGEPKRTPGSPKRTPGPPPPIASVVVKADPELTAGRQCPLYVNFRGQIVADENSTYETLNTKFRFVGDNGYESDWTTVPVKKNLPKLITGRRFIQSPKVDASGTVKAPGTTAKIPLYNGWMMAEVMLPNGGVRRSEKAKFSVDCNPKPVPAKLKTKP